MYDWRRMSPQQREEVLQHREKRGFPSHTPPHMQNWSSLYHITAACYEHQSIIGQSVERLDAFSRDLLALIEPFGPVHAWCVLPNHYHALIGCVEFKRFCLELGKFHGRTSFKWNQEEGTRKRKVFHNHSDRVIRSEAHYYATINYIHNNPVHHGYVKKWGEWPFSSYQTILSSMGREEVERIWKMYPLLDYGKGWDDAAT